ncbi:hypothetical protein D9M68_626810 [compost metagenome]
MEAVPLHAAFAFDRQQEEVLFEQDVDDPGGAGMAHQRVAELAGETSAGGDAHHHGDLFRRQNAGDAAVEIGIQAALVVRHGGAVPVLEAALEIAAVAQR